MFHRVTRRGFVAKSLTAGALAGVGDFAFLNRLPRLSAAEGKVTPGTVQLNADIEPLVRVIENTDREDLLPLVVSRIKDGRASYQQLLSAVFLAGVRGIQPRPVGFKFHAVLVINSAHLASLAAPDNDRWLPLFWAIDNFKSSQAQNKAQGDWHMPPVAEDKLPPAHQAKQRFVEAMDNWDEEGADRAVAALARTAGADEVFELFCRYGARDFRDIGHKAIYVANSYRTLQTIGWRHAEPVLRSLAYALLEHREPGNPAKQDLEPDRPGRDAVKRIAAMGHLDRATKDDPKAGAELLACLRSGSWSDGAEMVVELSRKGVHPRCVWDGLFLTAGELLMRQPGIVGLHCCTTVNALHYAYQTAGRDETRRLMMLQAAAFLPMFRQAMTGRGKLADLRLDDLQKAEGAAGGIEQIFHDVSKDRMKAARETLRLLESNPRAVQPLMATARRLVFSKGRDSHDYKFSSAALEDFYHLSPAWRTRYAAASMFNLRGADDPNNRLIVKMKGALS
ncbi:MAG TPA: hypothetical protein VFE78_31235 [Gemmataceae bacterium]|nr:hypothetical protein [Gemmataceae bacterium]